MKQFQLMRIMNQKLPLGWHQKSLMTRVHLDRWHQERRNRRQMERLRQLQLGQALQESLTFFSNQEALEAWVAEVRDQLESQESTILHLPVTKDLMDRLSLAWMTSQDSMNPSRRH